MTTTSARPELLHGYATGVELLADRIDAAHDLAQRAAAAYAAACPGYPIAPPYVASSVAEQARDLALGTDQIGQAFAAADRGSSPTTDPAAPSNHRIVIDPGALSQEIIATYPGLADADLARPGLELPGRQAAHRLVASDPDQRLDQLAQLDADLDDGHISPSFAAGLIDELGADGLTEVIDQITVRYGQVRLSINRADDAIAAVAHLIAAAGDQVDLGIIASMGRTPAGRNAIRELSIGATDRFEPSLVAAMATQTLIRHSAEDDGYGRGSSWNLLHHRLDLHGELARPDLPLLKALSADPDAAWAWERNGTDGVSPLALNLSRGGAGEPEAVADLLEAMLITPVEDGTRDAYRSEFEGPNRAPADREMKDTIDAVLRSWWAAEPEGRAVRTMQRLHAVHPDAPRHLGALDRYSGLPGENLVRTYEGQTADPTSRRMATDLAVEEFATAATRAVARASATGSAASTNSTSSTNGDDGRDADPDGLLSDLGAVHANSKALQAAAHRAGEHRNKAAAGAVAATKVVASKGTQAAIVAVASTMGPEGALAAAVGTQVAKDSLTCLAKEADARWVTTNQDWDDEVAAATEPREPYDLARAMAADSSWAKIVVHAEALDGLDVAGSRADWRSFLRWVDHQPDRVREPLRAIIEANVGDEFGADPGC